MHKVLESLIKEVNKEKLSLAELSEEERDALADRLVDEISADYGNTILKSSARNEYMIQRTKRMVRRTVWAIQKQLKSGEFEPEGVEVVFQAVGSIAWILWRQMMGSCMSGLLIIRPGILLLIWFLCIMVCSCS